MNETRGQKAEGRGQKAAFILEQGTATLNLRYLARFSKRGFAASTRRTRATNRSATSDLLQRALQMPCKAILESAKNPVDAQAHRARSADAAAACSQLWDRIRKAMERNGADLQVCQSCRVFGRLTFQAFAGCHHAGRATCQGMRRAARSAVAVRKSASLESGI